MTNNRMLGVSSNPPPLPRAPGGLSRATPPSPSAPRHFRACSAARTLSGAGGHSYQPVGNCGGSRPRNRGVRGCSRSRLQRGCLQPVGGANNLPGGGRKLGARLTPWFLEATDRNRRRRRVFGAIPCSKPNLPRPVSGTPAACGLPATRVTAVFRPLQSSVYAAARDGQRCAFGCWHPSPTALGGSVGSRPGCRDAARS